MEEEVDGKKYLNRIKIVSDSHLYRDEFKITKGKNISLRTWSLSLGEF
jgi:hypothetical protein